MLRFKPWCLLLKGRISLVGHLLTKPIKQKYAEDMKSAKEENWNLSLLAGLDSLGPYQPGGDCWCLWLQCQPQIWGLISWARKPRSISVCISGKHFLQFRSQSCSTAAYEEKNRKWSVGLLGTSHGGFLLWETPNAYFGFKITTAVFGGVIFC